MITFRFVEPFSIGFLRTCKTASTRTSCSKTEWSDEAVGRLLVLPSRWEFKDLEVRQIGIMNDD